MALVSCPDCGTQVSDAATACLKCGRPMKEAPPRELVQAPRWNRGVAALLSFLLPGTGSIYKGDVVLGIILFVSTVFGYFLLVVPGLVLHLLSIGIAASGDPLAPASKSATPHPPTASSPSPPPTRLSSPKEVQRLRVLTRLAALVTVVGIGGAVAIDRWTRGLSFREGERLVPYAVAFGALAFLGGLATLLLWINLREKKALLPKPR